MTEKDKEMWYGFCTYWTEDWDKLKFLPANPEFSSAIQGGVPCCPECGSPGFQMAVIEWNEGIKKFEAKCPGYAKFIEELREVCHGKGVDTGELWEKRAS